MRIPDKLTLHAIIPKTEHPNIWFQLIAKIS